ncbi:MAG: adenylate/guanylate cyclase domain-containing protein [Devosia sp.]
MGAERGVSRAALGWGVGLGAAIVAGLACATVLAWRAQDEINRRTVALAKTREALAPFISRHARARAANGPSSAQRLTVTVLFLDIRDFSTFADTSTPEDAAALVSTVASVAFAAVLRFDGDVDRLVGDGMVARFDGTDRRDRAWQSALTIMQELARLSLPRLVSLSLHDGVVIEATIGGQARADATILGRTVNIGSRLCSEAAPAELVVTDAMVPMPDGLTLHARGTDVMYLKGHREPFAVHRFGFGPTRAGATTQSRRQREATSLKECIAS